MFERFTSEARATVVRAQEEARSLHHDHIGTEHLLLALLGEDDGEQVTAVLRAAGLTYENARERVAQMVGRGGKRSQGHIPFTSRAKRVLDLALAEARHLGHRALGAEHILLGLLREGEGVAAQVIVGAGAALDQVRADLLRLLAGVSDQAGVPPAGPAAGRRRTPAAERVLDLAERLAGGSPVGSHHLAEALIRSEDAAAARALAALGMDADQLAAKLDELGLAGTADLTEEEAATSQMEIRVNEQELQVVLRDTASVTLARQVSDLLGGPVRGDDPVVGGLVDLHRQVVSTLAGLRDRLSPPASPDAEPGAEPGGTGRAFARAIQSRLRRR